MVWYEYKYQAGTVLVPSSSIALIVAVPRRIATTHEGLPSPPTMTHPISPSHLPPPWLPTYYVPSSIDRSIYLSTVLVHIVLYPFLCLRVCLACRPGGGPVDLMEDTLEKYRALS